MPRLFVAIDLAPDVAAQLARIQPSPLPGLRLATPNQMHLTLHFIGEAELDRVAAALATVNERAFALTIAGVGHFASSKGESTLWAGIKENAELLRLHDAVGAALATIGFCPEARRYRPHITLARCGPDFPSNLVSEFLKLHADFIVPNVRVDRILLYSSVVQSDASIHLRQQEFQLSA
jgi:2'-5' RNA ligase